MPYDSGDSSYDPYDWSSFDASNVSSFDPYHWGDFDWSNYSYYADYVPPDTIDWSQYAQTEIQNTALPGQTGYGWRYFSDGTAMDPSGKYYTNNPETGKHELVYDPASATGGFMAKLLNTAKSAFTKPDGSINWAALATAGVGLYNQMKGKESGGYNKPVPKLDMIQQQVQYNDPNRAPGSAGRQYFTDPRFVAQGDTAAADAARTAATDQATGIQAAYQPTAAPGTNPWAGKVNLAALTRTAPEPVTETNAYAAIPEAQGLNMAQGGIARLAKGGRYLSGQTDGMADKIPTSIDGKNPAALSHGEFVIPADVVSHLGNGNSEAGAQKLYDMMARIRKARTGTEKQGKRINPDKYMPGGLAKAYATGGAVKKYNGTTNGSVVAGTNAGGAGGIPHDISKTSTLSPWVGDYVTNALGQGAALANAPYQAYTGPLTAGASDLQQQAFAGASELAQTGYTPGTFDVAAANQYMNPYLSAALQPSLDEARRQAQVSRVEDAGRLTRAGAYGGSRQAIMESELNRNLMDKQNQMLTQGYSTAYDKAMGQFNTEEAARKGAADYTMSSIKNLADLGSTQRDITQQGLTADQKQFEEERGWAYKMPQYQLGLLQGLPIGANVTSTDQDTLSKLQSDISGLATLYKQLSGLGQTGSK